jgi:transcriptional regulator with XRE-family HTH domain
VKPTLFSKRLQSAIDAKDMTWPELANKSGYSASYLQRLISGGRCNPTIACVAALAQTLDVAPSWLLGLDP